MKCSFFNPNGSKCQANALKREKLCFTHSPKTKSALHEAAVKGGSMPKKNTLDLPPVTIKNSQDLIAVLQDTINLVRDGTMQVNEANSVGYLCNIILKTLQTTELEQRLEAVENLIKERKTL